MLTIPSQHRQQLGPSAAAAAPAAVAAAPVAAAPAVAAPAAPAGAPSGAAVADIPFNASDAIAMLLAYSAKVRPDQIGESDTTDTLTNGVSSRRNQLLMDISPSWAWLPWTAPPKRPSRR